MRPDGLLRHTHLRPCALPQTGPFLTPRLSGTGTPSAEGPIGQSLSEARCAAKHGLVLEVGASLPGGSSHRAHYVSSLDCRDSWIEVCECRLL
jgi:hypothetical protein